jgi:hypothetical protein
MSNLTDAGDLPSQTTRETRRNWTSCYPIRNRTEDWQCNFAGVICLETGKRYWARIWKKMDHHGKVYLSLNLKEKDGD